MTQHNLSKAVKIMRLKVDGTNYAAAAGTSDLNGEVVDMAGWEGAVFRVGFGAITSGAATSIKVQQGTDATVTDAADLEGSKVTVADTDDDKVAMTEIYRPRERYLRHVIDRGTQNAVVDFAEVILYGARDLPVTQDATVVGGEFHASPAEGTA